MSDWREPFLSGINPAQVVYSEGDGIIICADCRDVLPKFPAKSVDLVLTDPPYGIAGGRGGTSKQRGRGNYEADFEDTRDNVKVAVVPVIETCRRIAIAVVVTPGSKNLDLYPQHESFGCFYQPAACGMQHFGPQDSQPILYYGTYWRAGKWPQPCSFVLTEAPSCREHPCSKPILAWSKLLSCRSAKGHLILDPFLGSGTTAVAAVQLGRRFVGIEISAEYAQLAADRVRAAKQGMKLGEYRQGQQGLF